MNNMVLSQSIKNTIERLIGSVSVEDIYSPEEIAHAE